MSSHARNQARVIPLRTLTTPPSTAPRPAPDEPARPAPAMAPRRPTDPETGPRPAKEPLWRDVVGEVLRRERLAQERTLKDVAEAARISMPYLSELERGRKEASSEVLAAAAHALGLGLADLLALVHGELTGVRGVTPLRSEPTRARGAARRPGPGEVRLDIAA